MGSPAYGELLRGDLITKLGDYDSRDLRHDDAQQLFRNAGNNIHVVVRRDNKIALNQNQTNGSLTAATPNNSYTPVSNYESHPHRAPSPMPPGPDYYREAIVSPIATLPHTTFPHLNETGGYVAPIRPPSQASSCFSPMPTRDHQTEIAEETAAIVNQVFLSTIQIYIGCFMQLIDTQHCVLLLSFNFNFRRKVCNFLHKNLFLYDSDFHFS